MLNITTNKDQQTLLIQLEGRLDTTTSPDLEKVLSDNLDGVTDLTLDFEKVEYISSAGLRVLISAQKVMTKQGEMRLLHVCDEVREIFEVTGFLDFLNIE